MTKSVRLFDGHNLLFRYFQGMPRTILSSDGLPVHGAYGFIAAVIREVRQFRPDAVLVCFDSQVPSERNDLLATYKANRVKAFDPDDPNNPFTQLGVVKSALDYLEIPWVEEPGVEADDMIGSYAQAALARQCSVTIVSTDRDFLQLVSDQTSVYVKRGKNEITYTPELVQATFGIAPHQFVDFRVLTGDTSDNIQGIPGIGFKTAASLLQLYGTLNNIYEHLDIIKPKVAEALRQHQEKTRVNKDVLTIKTNIPVDETPLHTPLYQKRQENSARQVFLTLEIFKSKAT